MSQTSDVMVAVNRESGKEYVATLGCVPLAEVARAERPLPDDFIGPTGTDVSEAFVQYARPLIGAPLPDVMRFL
jgi:6-phosphofructokinase 1